VTPSPYATPGSIGPASNAAGKSDSNSQSGGKEIWDVEEVSEKQQYEYDDPRPSPEHDVIFKQAVGTEDVFLGMGPKNPSTASCESMVVSRAGLPQGYYHFSCRSRSSSLGPTSKMWNWISQTHSWTAGHQVGNYGA
jgi:hypothetical protein